MIPARQWNTGDKVVRVEGVYGTMVVGNIDVIMKIEKGGDGDNYTIGLLKYGQGHDSKSLRSDFSQSKDEQPEKPEDNKRAAGLMKLGQALDTISGLAQGELQRKLKEKIPEMVEVVAKELGSQKKFFDEAVENYLSEYLGRQELNVMVDRMLVKRVGGSGVVNSLMEDAINLRVEKLVGDMAIGRFVTHHLNNMDFKKFISMQVKEAVKEETGE